MKINTNFVIFIVDSYTNVGQFFLVYRVLMKTAGRKWAITPASFETDSIKVSFLHGWISDQNEVRQVLGNPLWVKKLNNNK